VNNHKKESKLASYGFVHYFVNHKLEFVSEVSKLIHTNGIESLWSQLKKELKKTRTTWSRYHLIIAKFYFQKTLSYDQQLRVLTWELTRLHKE